MAEAGPARVDDLNKPESESAAPRRGNRISKEEAERRMSNLEALHAQWDREKMQQDLKSLKRKRNEDTADGS